jgi:hypothetical protein
MPEIHIDPLIAAAVVAATALTDAIYVMFTHAVVKRKRLPAASWSSLWYLLSSFAVINYTHEWAYVLFAAMGSFIGAYASRPSCIQSPSIRRRRWAPRRAILRTLPEAERAQAVCQKIGGSGLTSFFTPLC